MLHQPKCVESPGIEPLSRHCSCTQLLFGPKSECFGHPVAGQFAIRTAGVATEDEVPSGHLGPCLAAGPAVGVRRAAHRPGEAKVNAVDDSPPLASDPVAAHSLQGRAKVEGIGAAGVAPHHLDGRPLQGRHPHLHHNGDLPQQLHQRRGLVPEEWRHTSWIAGCCRTATHSFSRPSTCHSSCACRYLVCA